MVLVSASIDGFEKGLQVLVLQNLCVHGAFKSCLGTFQPCVLDLVATSQVLVCDDELVREIDCSSLMRFEEHFVKQAGDPVHQDDVLDVVLHYQPLTR